MTTQPPEGVPQEAWDSFVLAEIAMEAAREALQGFDDDPGDAA